MRKCKNGYVFTRKFMGFTFKVAYFTASGNLRVILRRLR